MFENLLYQDRVVALLRCAIENNSLAPAFLFAGPAHSGKMTAAMELARGLGCKNPYAPWSCSCANCNRNRSLDNPYVLFMGRRRFFDEIHAMAKILSRTENRVLRCIFHRNLKKLIRRFDPLLWKDDPSKLAKAGRLIERLNDLCQTTSINLTTLDSLISDIEKILPLGGLSINMIRRAIYWARTTDHSIPRIIIIENAENMRDAARSALLKVLEEPPQYLFFILTTERPEAMAPTIRSRLQTIHFRPRSEKEFQQIISRIYRVAQPEKYRSIQAFFDDLRGGGLTDQDKTIKLMFSFLRKGSIRERDSLARMFASDRQAFRQCISRCLEVLYDSAERDADCLDIQRKLEEMQYRCEVYNIPVASALEHSYI